MISTENNLLNRGWSLIHSRCQNAPLPTRTSVDRTGPHHMPHSRILSPLRCPLHFIGEMRPALLQVMFSHDPWGPGQRSGQHGQGFLPLSPQWGGSALALLTAAPLTLQSHHHHPALLSQAVFTVHVGSTIPMPFLQLDSLQSSEGLPSMQCVSVKSTPIHPNAQDKTHIHSHT